MADLPGSGPESPIVPVSVPPTATRAKAPKAAPTKYRIIIEDGGQEDNPFVFVGVNGDTFKIMRGEEVEVPASVKEVLDHAMTTVMVKDSSNRKTSRRSPRFPYRVVAEVA